MDVVEVQDDGLPASEVAEERGQTLQQADPGRLPVGNGGPDHGDAAQKAGQVVENAPAQLGDLLQRELAEVLLERFRPQPERRRGAERAGPAHQSRRRRRRSGQHLLPEARLAHAGVPGQEDTPELAGRGPLQLRFERRQFACPSDKLPSFGHHTPSPPGYCGLPPPLPMDVAPTTFSGMFEGFEEQLVDVAADVRIHCVVAGSGPPVLLLHGYPQSLALWGGVAPRLAEHFTVVCADLRGYGDSSKPKGAPDASNYSFRVMAGDQVTMMHRLGFDRFHMVGQDRGGRTGHRMALDRPEVVES